MNNTARTALLSSVVSGIVSVLVVTGTERILTITPSGKAQNSVTTEQRTPPIQIADQNNIVETVKLAEPAVVSVAISKNVLVVQRFDERNRFFNGQPVDGSQSDGNGTRLRQIGGGTAFFVSADGLLMTNKHVVSDETAQYSVLLNDGRTLEAKVVGQDPVNDIALLKVEGSNFPYLSISDETTPLLGQSVIAIGNSLGEFRNTVSVGVISGLQRNIVAGGAGGDIEKLSRILQTDAAINEGNSGGPLVSTDGRVLGMSTAVATGAQNIGFAIPAQDLQRVLVSYQKYGHIVRPYIGIRYVPITPDLAEEQKLPVNIGALVLRGGSPGETAVAANSPAEKAGIKEHDIIQSIDEEELTEEFGVADYIQSRLPGDRVILHVLRDGKTLDIAVTLDEWKTAR